MASIAKLKGSGGTPMAGVPSSRRCPVPVIASQHLTVVCREGGGSSTPGLSGQSLTSLEYRVTRPSAQLRTRRVTTIECEFAISRRITPESCIFFALIKMRGRREDRVCAAPAISCAIMRKKARTRAYRFGGSIPAFPAQWLYGLLRALPGERLFCLRRPHGAFAPFGLNASTTAPEPHDFTVRISHTRPSWHLRPSHLPARQ
jgi:hypothetical protein